MTAADETHPRRFAFTAIDSSVRCAIDGGQRGLLAHVQRRRGELIDDRDQPRGAEIAQRGFDGAFREKCSRGNPLSSKVETGVPSATASADLCSQAAWRCAAEMIMPG